MGPIDPTTCAPGTRIGGDFTIVRGLSAGGMGALYVARHELLGYACAIKVMHPNLLSDPKLREKFVQESKLGARIASDHVVRVLGAGIDAALGVPWFAMELLEGQDLFDLVDKRGAQSPAFARDLFSQLGHGVGAAHDIGVVHRDLKPKNVFLARSTTVGDRQLVKVLDFGIAKVVADATLAGSIVIGSPYWMAPEQGALGQDITPATDVWALGLVAFYVLTGKLFWTSAVTAPDKPFAILLEIQSHPIPAASARARELGWANDLPAGFDAWFARCVVRDPVRRFEHARAATDALRPILDGAVASTAAAAPAAAGPTGTMMIDPALVAAARSAPREPLITAIHATPQSAATLALEHHTVPMGPGVGPGASVGPNPASMQTTRKVAAPKRSNAVWFLLAGIAILAGLVAAYLFALR